MSFLVCVVPVCPVRAEGSHRSEQVTQLLFGEECELVETGKEFIKVRCVNDDYEGWCQANNFEAIDNNHAIYPTRLTTRLLTEIACNEEAMHLPIGCNVGFLGGQPYSLGKLSFSYSGSDVWEHRKEKDSCVIETGFAMKYLNVPYLWGGRSNFGIDCSGLTQMIYLFSGMKLPRDASQQAALGEPIGFIQEATCGDLAFFDNEEGKITHVGMMLNSAEILHASGKVRIDDIDHAGIINRQTGQRTHKLRVIKRYF